MKGCLPAASTCIILSSSLLVIIFLAVHVVNPTQVGWTIPKVLVIIDYIFHFFLKPPIPYGGLHLPFQIINSYQHE